MPSSPFDLADAHWQQVSPKLAPIRRTISLIWLGIGALGMIVAATFVPWLWIGVGIILGIIGWLMWLIPRQVGAIGYAEMGDEFAVRRGIMFRKLILVPYGRMQYIEVDSGPLARKFGLATVTLHTAAVEDAEIPGVPVEEATRLRDRLTSRAESGLAGL